LFLVVLRAGVNVILAMPQIVWWFIGVAIMIVWGLHLLLRLGKNALPSIPDPLRLLRTHGRLSELKSCLYEANSETYSQDKVRQLLSSLAIDLISLRLDISEEEARNLYFRADWTEDEILKSYFYRERDTTAKTKRRLARWFKKPEPSSFLKETGEILSRLNHYSRSVNPVRNSSGPSPRRSGSGDAGGASNAAGIILEYNPVTEQRGIISNGVNGGKFDHTNGKD
jgi:hypothetical protein